MQFSTWLNEATWTEIYTGADAARRYPRDWIHFTNMQKIGINPSKSHRDPPGIYFYKCSWLNDDNIGSFQYAITMKYYYIARLRRTANGINLTTMTFDQAKQIAVRNGWWDAFLSVYENPKKYLSNAPTTQQLINRRKIGAIFYATADLLANGPDLSLGHMSWLKLLAGADYIIDKSGIIAREEPQQLIAINPRAIVLLDHGNNKQKPIHHDIPKQVMAKLGGSTYFKNGKIHGKLDYNGNPVEITFDLQNYHFFIHYYTSGIKVTNRQIPERGIFLDLPIEYDINNIASKILNFLKNNSLEKKGHDLFWNYNKLHNIFYQIISDGTSMYLRTDKGKVTAFGTSSTAVIELTTDATDTLTVKIKRNIYGQEKPVFSYRRILKPHDAIEEMIKEYITKYKRWYKKHETII